MLNWQNLLSNHTERIPNAAQRYCRQPRIGSSSRSAMPPAHHTRVSLTQGEDSAEGRQTHDEEREQENDGRREGTLKKQPKARKRPRSISGPARSSIPRSPIRQSPRLMNTRAAALERMLRERLLGNLSPPTMKSRKSRGRLSVDFMSVDLPALSEDPACYSSSIEDCRFHLPITIEDQLAMRAAMTPTLFRLQKNGWRAGVFWSPSASYMELTRNAFKNTTDSNRRGNRTCQHSTCRLCLR